MRITGSAILLDCAYEWLSYSAEAHSLDGLAVNNVIVIFNLEEQTWRSISAVGKMEIIVQAGNREHAIEMLDEIVNGEGMPLYAIADFMANFRLTDEGTIELSSQGQCRTLWNQANWQALCKKFHNVKTAK